MGGGRGEYQSWGWGRDNGWEAEGEGKGRIARKWPNEEAPTCCWLLIGWRDGREDWSVFWNYTRKKRICQINRTQKESGIRRLPAI